MKEHKGAAVKNADVIMILHFAELIAKEGISDKVLDLQFTALLELQAQLSYYSKLGYHEKLISGIAEKKGAMILKTATKTDMEKVMRPRPPHYNGAEFIPDAFSVPEEELICWSEVSLRAPLNSNGMRRYKTLFKQVFTDESQALGID